MILTPAGVRASQREAPMPKTDSPTKDSKGVSSEGPTEERIAALKRGVVDRAAERFKESIRKIYPNYEPK